jgi:hypothetical protein
VRNPRKIKQVVVGALQIILLFPYVVLVYGCGYIHDTIKEELADYIRNRNGHKVNVNMNSFLNAFKWFKLFIQSTNHMMIGFLYICVGILGGTIGFALSIIIRLELSLPAYVLTSALQYNSNITFHGLLMIFFMIMPILIGGFGNLLVPVLIGASDMIFPRLNALSL